MPLKVYSTTSSKIPLWAFVWNSPGNRTFLFWAMGVSLFEFIVFKILYPYPDFISDSYSYIYAASQNLDLSIWPIGYSKFLYGIHHISHSDLCLVACQFLLLLAASLYFVFSIFNFIPLSKVSKFIIFAFFFCNPSFFYLSNFINSDALFLAMSLLWLAELCKILYQPNLTHLLLHAILLFLCFAIRNNAYYYPLVSFIGLLMSKQAAVKKIIGIGVPLTLIIGFVLHTQAVAYRMTGTRQYSLFTGWQLANNALYAYPFMHVANGSFQTPQCKQLDTLVRAFYNVAPVKFENSLYEYVGNYFIRESHSPLKQYFYQHYLIKNQYDIIISWGKASAIFEKYGTELVRHNPFAFARGYFPVSAKNYFFPPLSNFLTYNSGEDKISVIAKDWFDYKSPQVYAVSKNLQSYLMFIFTPLFFFLNLYTMGALVLLYRRKALFSKYKTLTPIIVVMSCLLSLNFGFTIVAIINILRYQIFPMAVFLICSLSISELK